MGRSLILGCLTFLTLALPGCGGSRTLPPDLFGKDWTLVELNGQPVSLEKPPSLRFEEPDLVTGFGGCNRLSGKYTFTGNELRFSPLIMTKMACPETMEIEAAFASALEATRRVQVAGSSLELLGEAGPLAKLSAR